MESIITAGVREALGAPLDPTVIQTLSVDGRQVSYLPTHYVIRRANDLFGHGNWGLALVPWGTSGAPGPQLVEKGQRNSGKDYEVWGCAVMLEVAGAMPITEVGTNVRSGSGPEGLEMAWKGCYSDAVKRCFHHYGDQFGLVLYDKGADPEAEQREADMGALAFLGARKDKVTPEQFETLKKVQATLRAGQSLDKENREALKAIVKAVEGLETATPSNGHLAAAVVAAGGVPVEKPATSLPLEEEPFVLNGEQAQALVASLRRVGRAAEQVKWLLENGFGEMVAVDGKSLDTVHLTAESLDELLNKLGEVALVPA